MLREFICHEFEFILRILIASECIWQRREFTRALSFVSSCRLVRVNASYFCSRKYRKSPRFNVSLGHFLCVSNEEYHVLWISTSIFNFVIFVLIKSPKVINYAKRQPCQWHIPNRLTALETANPYTPYTLAICDDVGEAFDEQITIKFHKWIHLVGANAPSYASFFANCFCSPEFLIVPISVRFNLTRGVFCLYFMQ